MSAPPESPVLETPKWLEALEQKRNRPHRLAHEIGAGAPCLVCGDKCKGLNLHFWRKLCTDCKCRKEDHDVVEEDDYGHFEILFGAQKVKRTTLKFNAQNKTFDWIPPNISPELAADYLNALPQSKRPIVDSEGAKHRRQQLERQLPRHDMVPDACHDLSDQELTQFLQYLDNLKNNVVGQGRVAKYGSPALYQEDRQNYGSGIDLANSQNPVGVAAQSAGVQARFRTEKTPGYSSIASQRQQNEAFPLSPALKTSGLTGDIATSDFQKGFPASAFATNLAHSRNTDYQPLKSQNINRPFIASGTRPFAASDMKPFPASDNAPFVASDNVSKQFGLKTPSEYVDNSKRPVYDRWNNNPTLDNVAVSNPDDNSNEGGQRPGLETSPYDATMEKGVLSRFNELNISSDAMPFVPLQESQIMHMKKGSPHPSPLPPAYPPPPPPLSPPLPSPPQTCTHCLLPLSSSDVVVATERGGSSSLWHARCFVCTTCKELLVDLMYFYHQGEVYCGRHYAEVVNMPRCFACDELIFVKEYTIAEDASFHVRHFCCFHCDQPLAGKQYIPKDSQPVCLDCYQARYGKSCVTCKNAIGPGEQRVTWKHLDFHVTGVCFRCAFCRKSLLGGTFTVRDDETFCSAACFKQFQD